MSKEELAKMSVHLLNCPASLRLKDVKCSLVLVKWYVSNEDNGTSLSLSLDCSRVYRTHGCSHVEYLSYH